MASQNVIWKEGLLQLPCAEMMHCAADDSQIRFQHERWGIKRVFFTYMNLELNEEGQQTWVFFQNY